MGAKATMAQRVVAFLLSFFAVGVGQLFMARTRRALGWLAFGVLGPPFAAWITIAAARTGHLVLPLVLLVSTLLARPLSAIDAATLHPGEKPRPRGLWLGAAFIASIGLVVASALFTRVFVLESFKLPASSMLPTLRVGDHVFVDKQSTSMRRGKLMVFRFPENRDQDFVKRVIATAGDHLEVRDHHPWINGWEVPHCLVGHGSIPKGDEPGAWSDDVFVEYLEGQSYLTLVDPTAVATASGSWTVAPNESFVLGDNRDSSYDSRQWHGGLGAGVPAELARGEPFVVWLSVGPEGLESERVGFDFTKPLLPRSLASLKPALERCLASQPPREATIPPRG